MFYGNRVGLIQKYKHSNLYFIKKYKMKTMLGFSCLDDFNIIIQTEFKFPLLIYVQIQC